MTFARINPLGYALFEILTSSQMNQFDINATLALDGGGGGGYTPADTLSLDGVSSSFPSNETFRSVAPLQGAAAVFTNQVVMNNGAIPIVTIEGAGPRQLFGTGAASSILVNGQVVTDATPPAAGRFTGGATELDGAPMGPGIQVFGGGGAGAVAPTNAGGTAVQAIGSVSRGTDTSLRGGSGIVSTGGDGEDQTKGGVGGEFTGGDCDTFTSAAGAGIEAHGGLAIGGSTTPAAGAMLVMGGNEPTSFRASTRAGLIVGGSDSSGEGRAIRSIYEGTVQGVSANQFIVEGAPTTQLSIASYEFTATDIQPGATANNLILGDSSGAENCRVISATSQGDCAAIELQPQENTAGENGVHLDLQPLAASAIPTSYHSGGLVYLNSAFTDQEDTGLYMATGVQGGGLSFYDRVVGANDPAAVFAWAQIETDGAGGASVIGAGNNGSYNIGTTVISGTNIVITLKAGCGPEFNCPQVSLMIDSVTAGAVNVICDSIGTGVYNVALINSSGTPLSVSTLVFRFNFSVTGAVGVGTLINSTRPTRSASYP